MLRLSRWIAVVAILLSASVAFAQRPGGGRPGGFGGGFGGGGKLMLVNNEAVQKELALKEDQISKLKTLGESVREEMRSAFTGGFGGRDQSEDERAKAREKMAESIKKMNDKYLPKLDEILDASQRERLQQITWQNARSQAYQDAGVIAALKITKEQQEKLAAVSKDFGEKQGELFRQGGDEARAKGRDLSETRDKALSQVLTADQREQFTKLLGKKFDTDQLRGGFGGPGGGRPGQGAGGANPGAAHSARLKTATRKMARRRRTAISHSTTNRHIVLRVEGKNARGSTRSWNLVVHRRRLPQPNVGRTIVSVFWTSRRTGLSVLLIDSARDGLA